VNDCGVGACVQAEGALAMFKGKMMKSKSMKHPGKGLIIPPTSFCQHAVNWTNDVLHFKSAWTRHVSPPNA
jgi:hypothetical protein